MYGYFIRTSEIFFFPISLKRIVFPFWFFIWTNSLLLLCYLSVSKFITESSIPWWISSTFPSDEAIAGPQKLVFLKFTLCRFDEHGRRFPANIIENLRFCILKMVKYIRRTNTSRLRFSIYIIFANSYKFSLLSQTKFGPIGYLKAYSRVRFVIWCTIEQRLGVTHLASTKNLPKNYYLVPFVQSKKAEKYPWSVTFSKVAGKKPVTLVKITLLHVGCFSRFLNCTNSAKSRKTYNILKSTFTHLSEIYHHESRNFKRLPDLLAQIQILLFFHYKLG